MSEEWRKVRLSDFVTFNPKITLKKGAVSKYVPMDKVRPFTKHIASLEERAFLGGSRFCNGDTIMARITPCLENGKTAYIDFLEDGEAAWGSTEFLVLRAKPGISCPQFVYYLATSPKVRTIAIKSMSGTSGRQRVQQDMLENLEVRVPDLPTQRRVAAVLSALDSKIEVNARISANLEAQARAVFRARFPYGAADALPDGWRAVPLSEIADFVAGYSYKGSELQPSNIAMATIKNFDRNGGFKIEGYKEIVPSSKIKPCQYAGVFDVVVAHTDITQKAEIIGNAEMILSLAGHEAAVFSMDLVKVVPKGNSVSRFMLAAMLRSPRFKAHCLEYANGTTVLHLSKKALPDYKLVLPLDMSELLPLDNALSAIYRQMAALCEQSRRLASLRDLLLPRLMSGELDVSAVKA